MGWKDGAGRAVGGLLKSSGWVVLRPELGQKRVPWRQHRQSVTSRQAGRPKAQAQAQQAGGHEIWGWGWGVGSMRAMATPILLQDLLHHLP